MMTRHQFPSDQIRAAAEQAGRQPARLRVAKPWAWLWWPGDRPIVHEDPDLTDRRTPRPISAADVDWFLVLHAVRYAISRLPVDPWEALKLDEVEVDLPFSLTGKERDLAQSWVGEGTADPITPLSPIRRSDGEVPDRPRNLTTNAAPPNETGPSTITGDS